MVQGQAGATRKRGGAEATGQGMTTPTKLVFREWKKPEVTYELHGWKRDKALAFVIDDKGQPLVLEFVLPAQFNEHDRPTAAFSQLPPTDVTEIRLVPPPCRADQAEAHALRVRARANTDAVGTVFPDTNWNPSRWELVRLSYDSEILILKPGDDAPLADILNKFKVEKRSEYDERKQEIHSLLELVRHRQPICGRARYYAHLVSNGYKAPSADSAAVWQHFLNQERIRLDIDFGQGGYQRGFLQWTSDDARRHPDIRDPFLQSRWAKENGLDLQQMALERKQIAAWTGMVDSGNSVAKFFKDTLGDGIERMDFPTAPSPAALDMAKASDLELGASIRFRVTFANESLETWLTACRRRGPEPHERADFGAAQGKIVTMETIKNEQGQVLTKLDSVEKKTDKVLSGVQTLTELAGEQAAARDEWRENPLGSRESVADYLLTMDAMKVERGIAAALVRFGYGDSREQCAETAGVSVATIKRALAKARETPYANFFARSRAQKIKARGAMKKPDELYTRLMQLAAKDPDELRAMTEQMIAKAQGESDGGNAWDKTVQGLS
jgi:hypothetical protein